MKNKELIELWRKSGEPNFITWLNKREEFFKKLRNRQLNRDEIEDWAMESLKKEKAKNEKK